MRKELPANNMELRIGKKTYILAGFFVLIVFLFWCALQLYVPTLSIFIQNRTNDLALTGFVLSMYGLAGLVIRLPLGIASDWLGRRKPFIISGMVLAGLGAILMAATSETYLLAIGRALTGLAAASWVPMIVLFTSLFPPSITVKATAVLTVALSLSRMVATSLTGWLNELGGYSLAFMISAGIAAVAILLLIPAREKRNPVQVPSWSVFKKLLLRRDILVPSLLNIIGQYVGVAAVFSFGPILAKELGAGNITLGLLVTWNLIFYSLGNLSATFFTSVISRREIVLASFVLMAAGLGILAFAQSVVWIFIAHACYGFAGGNNYPVLMGSSIKNVTPGEQSTALGLHQTIYSIGTFIGPWLSGLIANEIGIQPMFGATAFFVLVLGFLGVLSLTSRSFDKNPHISTNK